MFSILSNPNDPCAQMCSWEVQDPVSYTTMSFTVVHPVPLLLQLGHKFAGKLHKTQTPQCYGKSVYHIFIALDISNDMNTLNEITNGDLVSPLRALPSRS